MTYIGTDGVGTNVYIDDDGTLWFRGENTSMRITSEDMYIIDKYGNEMSMTELKACFKPNAPTYDDLYEHWLKTR